MRCLLIIVRVEVSGLGLWTERRYGRTWRSCNAWVRRMGWGCWRAL